jgi:Lrp/AsnC family transcriptional regulator for asnA, asnC and gidA
MDGKDRRIIEMLMEDARVPYTEIAKRLGVSEATVRKRIRALEEGGVIERYSVVVRPEKLGYGTQAIVGMDVEPSRFLEVAEHLTRLEEIRSVATSTGDHMIMTEIWTRDGRELATLISGRIGKIEGIKRICPAIILEKLKS